MKLINGEKGKSVISNLNNEALKWKNVYDVCDTDASYLAKKDTHIRPLINIKGQ